MSSAFEALPLIFPFFGVLSISFSVGFCMMNRRIRNLTNRIAELEAQRTTQPQIVIERPPPPLLTPPPIYPVQQQQPFPYYYQSPPSAPPPPSAHPPPPSAPYSSYY